MNTSIDIVFNDDSGDADYDITIQFGTSKLVLYSLRNMLLRDPGLTKLFDGEILRDGGGGSDTRISLSGETLTVNVGVMDTHFGIGVSNINTIYFSIEAQDELKATAAKLAGIMASASVVAARAEAAPAEAAHAEAGDY